MERESERGAKHHGVFYEDIRNNRKITTLIKSWRRDLTVHKNIPKNKKLSCKIIKTNLYFFFYLRNKCLHYKVCPTRAQQHPSETLCPDEIFTPIKFDYFFVVVAVLIPCSLALNVGCSLTYIYVWWFKCLWCVFL